MKNKTVFVACDTSDLKKGKIIFFKQTKKIKLFKVWSSIFIQNKVENS